MISENGALNLLRLRLYHHQINEMLKAGKYAEIPIHLAFGREAVAVALDLVMQGEDGLCLTHRNIAYNLARTKSLKNILLNFGLLSQAANSSLMGSMNLAHPDHGVIYSSSILGNNLAVAAGVAMNRLVSGRAGLVYATTGDGAIEEGVFWETLIFARTHGLRLVVIVENDNCSMSSTINQRRCPVDLSKVCSGLDIEYISVDGANLDHVLDALTRAKEVAFGSKPAIVECHVETFCQHAGPTPGWPSDPLNISFENGLIVRNDDSDPIYQMMAWLGSEKYNLLLSELLRSE